MSNFRLALETALGRPVTDDEVATAWSLGHPAGRLLRRRIGPVPRSQYPDAAVALAVVRIVARVVEAGGGVVEVTDDDLRWLAQAAAMMRPPHPFLRA